jgi:hypothetical protein
VRDIPLFTTANGAASLYLKKIPFTKEAFVHIRDSLACDELVKECIDVCRMAGAEQIYATGHENLKRYPLYCSVQGFSVQKDRLASTDAVALPVSPHMRDWWRQIYNEKMACVATASALSLTDVEKLIQEGKAYCIYRDCIILGIGVCYDGLIHAVASVVPGSGRDSVLALADCMDCQTICLSVASTNDRAIRLYRSLGFTEAETYSLWYKISGC